MRDNVEKWYREAISKLSELLPGRKIDIDLVYNDKDINFLSRYISHSFYRFKEKTMTDRKKDELASYLYDLEHKSNPRYQAIINTHQNFMALGDKMLNPDKDNFNPMNRAIAKFSNPEQRFNYLFFHELGHFVDKEVFNETIHLFQNQPDVRAKDWLEKLCEKSFDTIKQHVEHKNKQEDIHFAVYIRTLKKQAGEMYADCFSSIMGVRNGKFSSLEEVNTPIIEARLLSNEGLGVFNKGSSPIIIEPNYHNSAHALLALESRKYHNIQDIHDHIISIIEKTIINQLYQGSLINDKFNDFLMSVEVNDSRIQKELFIEDKPFKVSDLFSTVSQQDLIKNYDRVLTYKLIEYKVTGKANNFFDYLHPDSELKQWVHESAKTTLEFDEITRQYFDLIGVPLSEAINSLSDSDFDCSEYNLARACDRAMAVMETPIPSKLKAELDNKQAEIFERVSDKSKIADIIKKGMNKIYYSPPEKIKFKN